MRRHRGTTTQRACLLRTTLARPCRPEICGCGPEQSVPPPGAGERDASFSRFIENPRISDAGSLVIDRYLVVFDRIASPTSRTQYEKIGIVGCHPHLGEATDLWREQPSWRGACCFNHLVSERGDPSFIRWPSASAAGLAHEDAFIGHDQGHTGLLTGSIAESGISAEVRLP